jgi:hypothetical protein
MRGEEMPGGLFLIPLVSDSRRVAGERREGLPRRTAQSAPPASPPKRGAFQGAGQARRIHPGDGREARDDLLSHHPVLPPRGGAATCPS